MKTDGAQDKRLTCGMEGCRGRWIDTNLSGKEINGAVCPIGSKHETTHPPSTQASPFSGSSRGSRKRVRYPPNMPTVLKKRAVALESTAGALTMPEIEGPKSPIKQDYFVKTDVHVSF